MKIVNKKKSNANRNNNKRLKKGVTDIRLTNPAATKQWTRFPYFDIETMLW